MELNSTLLGLVAVKQLRKLFTNNAGSSLVMVIILTVGLGAMALSYMRYSQTNTRVGTRYQADADVNEAMTRIVSLINTPTNCNATFYNLPTGGVNNNLPAIYKCNSGSCKTAPDRIAVIVPTTANWLLFNDETIPRNARIIRMTYTIVSPQQTGATTFRPALLRLTVDFEKKVGLTNATMTTSKVSKVAETYVVTNTYNYTTWTLGPVNATILGCPRTPSSTMVY